MVVKFGWEALRQPKLDPKEVAWPLNAGRCCRKWLTRIKKRLACTFVVALKGEYTYTRKQKTVARQKCGKIWKCL
jgi:hypothetical protein